MSPDISLDACPAVCCVAQDCWGGGQKKGAGESYPYPAPGLAALPLTSPVVTTGENSNWLPGGPGSGKWSLSRGAEDTPWGSRDEPGNPCGEEEAGLLPRCRSVARALQGTQGVRSPTEPLLPAPSCLCPVIQSPMGPLGLPLLCLQRQQLVGRTRSLGALHGAKSLFTRRKQAWLHF